MGNSKIRSLIEKTGLNNGLFIIGAMYLAITHCFYLLPDNIFVFPVGKMYDVVLVFAVAVVLLYNGVHLKFITEKSKIITYTYAIWLIYCGFEFINALRVQSLGSAIRGIRENFLFLIFFVILNLKDFDAKKALKLLFWLEMASAVISIVHAFAETPFLYAFCPTQDIAGFTFLRSYADIPVLKTFFIAYLLIGIMEKNYCYNIWLDIICFIVIVLGIVSHFHRAYYVCIAMAVVLCFFLSKMKINNLKKLLLLLAAVAVAAALLWKVFPEVCASVWNDFYKSRQGMEHGKVRVDDFIARYEVLKREGKLLFGFGTVSADMLIPDISSYMPSVRNIDITYSTIMIRYGIFGLALFVSFWLVCGVKALRSKTKLGKAVFVFIVSCLLLALTGETIIDYSLMLLGILMGIWTVDTSQPVKSC